MIATEEIYQMSKTVCRITKIEDDNLFTQKKVTLHLEEAKLLLSRGVTVYREEITKPNGDKFGRLFCYITLEQLINASK